MLQDIGVLDPVGVIEPVGPARLLQQLLIREPQVPHVLQVQARIPDVIQDGHLLKLTAGLEGRWRRWRWRWQEGWPPAPCVGAEAATPEGALAITAAAAAAAAVAMVTRVAGTRICKELKRDHKWVNYSLIRKAVPSLGNQLGVSERLLEQKHCSQAGNQVPNDLQAHFSRSFPHDSKELSGGR